ncbi:DUF2218 domain-containing protein [Labrys neptuniae]
MKRFVAQARIELPDPEAVIGPLCEHFIEHGAAVEQRDGAHILRFRGAQARFSKTGPATLVDTEAESLEELYFIRQAVASHILEFAQGRRPAIAWTGDGTEISRPPNFQIFRVIGVKDVTPRMRRITFSASDVSRYQSMEALHLNILAQHPDLSEAQWPCVGPDGLIHWPDPDRKPSLRKYTVRSLDVAAGTLDIDFVRHADAGPGSILAESVKPGEEVGVLGPGGGGLAEADWYLFVGDETALPAIGRMLERLPASARGKALIEVADESEIQQLDFAAAIEIEWLFRNGAPAGTTNLLVDAVSRTALPGDGSRLYAWVGCEYQAFRTLRAQLLGERGLRQHKHLIVAYWRRGHDEIAH